MGLDVYAGTLTRYYSDGWEALWARRAREAGMESMTVRGGQPVEKGDPGEVGRMVHAWRDALNEALSESLDGSGLDWDESEDAPYFRQAGPGRLRRAHAARRLRHAPTRGTLRGVARRLAERPGVQGVHRVEPRRVSVRVHYGPRDVVARRLSVSLPVSGVAGEEVAIGSVDLLRANLHGLNERTFRADPETAARWLRGEVEAENHFEAHARRGFAVFLYLAEQAVANRLPMKLDY